MIEVSILDSFLDRKHVMEEPERRRPRRHRASRRDWSGVRYRMVAAGLAALVIAMLTGAAYLVSPATSDAPSAHADETEILAHSGALPTTDAELTSVERLFIRVLEADGVPVAEHKKHVVQVAGALCGDVSRWSETPEAERISVVRVLLPHWTVPQAETFVAQSYNYCHSLVTST